MAVVAVAAAVVVLAAAVSSEEAAAAAAGGGGGGDDDLSVLTETLSNVPVEMFAFVSGPPATLCRAGVTPHAAAVACRRCRRRCR